MKRNISALQERPLNAGTVSNKKQRVGDAPPTVADSSARETLSIAGGARAPRPPSEPSSPLAPRSPLTKAFTWPDRHKTLRAPVKEDRGEDLDEHREDLYDEICWNPQMRARDPAKQPAADRMADYHEDLVNGIDSTPKDEPGISGRHARDIFNPRRPLRVPALSTIPEHEVVETPPAGRRSSV